MAKSRRSKSKSKVNLPIAMAMVLLYLTIFSIYLTSGLYAKYTAKDNAQDGARVAGFHVDVTGIQPMNVIDATSEPAKGMYHVTVKNKSEVTVKYYLYVTFQEELPDCLQVKLDAKGEAKEGTKSEDKKTIYFNDVGALGTADSENSTETVSLVFEIVDTDDENSKIDVEMLANLGESADVPYVLEYTDSNQENDLYQVEFDFDIYVNAVQID